jgi:hypothetical protein
VFSALKFEAPGAFSCERRESRAARFEKKAAGGQQ